ncbi:hypothetical protein SeMB42_g00477 [Synchytrium endobioticum]|uniref:Uncharacterized protein n=1 Tax=Synchytrium endobioticum TaxID=286115 RepID=A0A507DI62_9FUNG|nr:hypothetical protein SeLEV6574_g00339 [Synchytrium endobioticum]TPX54080.1 hypothetical protein SeMB42_g00477 [Synchytrium endobioticum]
MSQNGGPERASMRMTAPCLYIYQDNSVEFIADQHYYHLSPSASTLIVEPSTQPLSARCKQLTSLAPSKHIQAIQTILSIRNTYVENPYLSARLCTHQALERATLTNTAIESARWPLPPVPCHTPHTLSWLTKNADGSIRIQSLDAVATLTLASHKRTFVVQYPAAVDDPEHRAARIQARRITEPDVDDDYPRPDGMDADHHADADGLSAIVHGDNAVFESIGGFRFLTLHNPHADTDTDMYPTDAAPSAVHNPITGQRYPFKDIVDGLLRLYTNMHLSRAGWRMSASSAGSAGAMHEREHSHAHAPYSSRIWVDADIPHVGRFTAYTDARVAVTFVDRTILEIDASALFAKILDCFGESITVRVANPLAYANYVKPAMQFRRWATADEEERRVIKSERDVVAAKLKRALGRSQFYIIQQGPHVLRSPPFTPNSPKLSVSEEVVKKGRHTTVKGILESVRLRNTEFIGRSCDLLLLRLLALHKTQPTNHCETCND